MTNFLRITMLIFVLISSINGSCQAKWIEVDKIGDKLPLSYSTEMEYVPNSEQTKVNLWVKLDIDQDDPLSMKMLPGLKSMVMLVCFDFSAQQCALLLNIAAGANGNIINSTKSNSITFEPYTSFSPVSIPMSNVYRTVYQLHTENKI